MIVLSGNWSCKDLGDDGDGIRTPSHENPLPTDDTPAWSPDGQFIAYTHTNVDLNDASYPTGIYIIDTSGNNRRLVIAGPAYTPDWSPDGSRIIFSSGELFTISPLGDSLSRITLVGSAFFPSWSLDGQKIVFDTPYQDPHGANAISIVNSDGSGLRDISQHGTGEWRDPDWSPGGSEIVHYRFIGVGTSEIFKMDSSGKNAIRLTFNVSDDLYPKWSPDGSAIAWTSSRTHTSWVCLMDTNGNTQIDLVEGGYPTWSPDSHEVAFSRLAPTEDKGVIWIINRNGTGARPVTK